MFQEVSESVTPGMSQSREIKNIFIFWQLEFSYFNVCILDKCTMTVETLISLLGVGKSLKEGRGLPHMQ